MYTLLVQYLNPKLRYIGNDKSSLALDAVQDIYALAIYNIKQSRQRQGNKFLPYPIPQFCIRDKVLVRNHTIDILDQKYNVAYLCDMSDDRALGINRQEW